MKLNETSIHNKSLPKDLDLAFRPSIPPHASLLLLSLHSLSLPTQTSLLRSPVMSVLHRRSPGQQRALLLCFLWHFLGSSPSPTSCVTLSLSYFFISSSFVSSSPTSCSVFPSSPVSVSLSPCYFFPSSPILSLLPLVSSVPLRLFLSSLSSLSNHSFRLS